MHDNIDGTSTLRSLSSLLGDLFREFWMVNLGGVRDYLGEVFRVEIKGTKTGRLYRKTSRKIKKFLLISFKKLLSSKYLTDY